MTCPFCQHQLESPPPDRCPDCGGEFVHLTTGLVKTSSVLIAAGGKRTVYRSVQEVPEPWRGRLIECTNGRNSATIVIADHGGRQHIAESVRRHNQTQLAAATPAAPAVHRPEPGHPAVEALATSRSAWFYVVAILLALLMVASLWMVLDRQW